MIRYIGGTLNYMGSGNLNMEYPYDNPNNYNFWKPGNGYFPRGEAPPPYEEAVALAQAEAMSAQCTVRLVELMILRKLNIKKKNKVLNRKYVDVL